ncbi:MAG: aminoglycoside phosphotransferase family protein [Brachybacterium sp.]|nr:aminoglycoside phosphotransferase family protein [Brachybacterium sp.]
MTLSSTPTTPDLTDEWSEVDSPAVSPETGGRILDAWAAGTLVPRDAELPCDAPPPQAGVGRPPARVAFEGIGESFAAWRLVPNGATELIVRIPWRDVHRMPQPLSQEPAALAQLPPGVSIASVAAALEADHSPIGMPYLIHERVPGTAKDPEDWTDADIDAHARQLAVLHQVTVPGRGPLRLGGEAYADLLSAPMSIRAEADSAFAWWRAEHPQIIGRPGITDLLEAALERCRVADEAGHFAALEEFVLVHGDLGATNVLWLDEDDEIDQRGWDAPAPPRFIDFEWAQADDPARDLAIIGGTVHADPWYVAMNDAQIDRFIGVYAAEVARLRPDASAACTDPAQLRARRDAWEVYERTAMLLHVILRAEDSPMHAEALPTLHATLARRLGIDPG